MTILTIISWIYLIGLGTTFLYWMSSFGIRLLTVAKHLRWEDLKYFFKILFLTTPLSWFGLYLSIKAQNALKKEKKKLSKTARNYGFSSDNNFIHNKNFTNEPE